MCLEAQQIFLTDWRHWNQVESSLNAWCQERDIQRMGMFLRFPDAKTFTAFVLTWG